jgi:U4/U6 small nuclear ribonucleoprotein PRP31
MSGLADELIADLEGLSDDGDDVQDQENPAEPVASSSNGLKRKADAGASDEDMSEPEGEEGEGEQEIGGLVLPGGMKPADELDAEDVQQMELSGIEDVSKITKLDGSKRMSDILQVGGLLSVGGGIILIVCTPGNRKIPSKSDNSRNHGSPGSLEP